MHTVWDQQDAPLYTVAATLGFEPFFENISYDEEDGFEGLLLYTPVFSFCADDLRPEPIVWDLPRLIASFLEPGQNSLITCSCGYPDCAGIEDAVCVAHPDADTLVWEFDIQSFRTALCADLQNKEGYLRFVISRASYKSMVLDMVATMKRMADNPLSPAEIIPLTDRKGLETLPPETRINVECFGTNNTEIQEYYAEVMAMDWTRTPLFPTGTTVDIGVYGESLFCIDGVLGGYAYCTRIAVKKAFRRWRDTLTLHSYRKTEKASSEPSVYRLKEGVSAEECHRAGREFAALFAMSLAEGDTAPNVTVRYVEMDLESPCAV